jgi:hypothetical protein
MRIAFITSLLARALTSIVVGAPDDGLVAWWNFDEGDGNTVHDRSGYKNDGKVHGAQWVKCGKGHALQFDGENDFVDCGNGASLDITGPISVQAWVQPDAVHQGEPGICGKFFETYAITYYGDAYWYISSGGNNVNGPLKIDAWTHVVGTFDGTMLRIYINGQEAQTKESRFKQINHGRNFLIACIADSVGADEVPIGTRGFFPGLIDSVRVHSRALSPDEVLHYYNLEAAEKSQSPLEVGKLHQLRMESFFYPDSQMAVLSVNFRRALPLAEGSKILAELVATGPAAGQSGSESPPTRLIHRKELNPRAAHFEDEAEFSLKELNPGEYEFRGVVRNAGGAENVQCTPFRLPLNQLPVAAPEMRIAALLPPPVMPPSYEFNLAEGGGFAVQVNGQTHLVESSYSYPDGGDNRLLAAAPDRKGEPTWRVSTEKLSKGTYHVGAEGQFYAISRHVELAPSRVVVKDTIRNKTSDVVGIILSNHINTSARKGVKVTMMGNPSLFVGRKDCGVGLVALDDLYQIRQRTTFSGGLAQIRDENFGLDKGASYTVEWAVYPTATNDYYDFINQVRKDEGLNGHVEGAFAFVDRRTPPSKELIELKKIKYASIGCLGFPPDDATVSLEGWEFTEYPKESAALKKTMGDTQRMYPGIRAMFHVAHPLYATDKPEKLFGDSRALDTNGRQFHYGPNTIDYYGNYFSRKRFEEGWRWWLFYPTMTNSFGRAMIRAAEVMVNDLGATGMWADGYFLGYIPGGYSYDRWDGLSVTIDPKTKQVTRKKLCVTYAALPVLKKVAEVIGQKNGVVITNGCPGPRSVWRMPNLITSCETSGGDQRPVGELHLGRTTTPLGNPTIVKNQRDIYSDMLNKLDYGALYFWYGDQDFMKHKTLVEHMYPITFESIHAGIVRGRERIVTKRSGVYGWPGDRSLHIIHLYDARGALTPHDFLTTSDRQGVRSEVALKENQSAVVVRLPTTLDSPSPVNIRVSQYDTGGIRMSLNGTGPARLTITNGDFPIDPARRYAITTGSTTTTVAPDAKNLIFSVNLPGPTDVTVTVHRSK